MLPIVLNKERVNEKIFQALADNHRLSILMEIAAKGSLSFSEAQNITDLSQPCVSHHLKLLTDSGLVISKKDGRNLTLLLNKDMLHLLADFLRQLTEKS